MFYIYHLCKGQWLLSDAHLLFNTHPHPFKNPSNGSVEVSLVIGLSHNFPLQIAPPIALLYRGQSLQIVVLLVIVSIV